MPTNASTNHPERHGKPQQIRSEFPPAGAGAVGNRSHNRVIDGVPDTGHQKHRADGRRGDAEDIGVKIQQEIDGGLKEKIGCGISQAKTDLFPDRKSL